MKYRFILGLFILATSSVNTFAQKKTLTINDAVMGQYRQFSPDRVMNFQWLESNIYAYLEHYTCLIKAEVNKEKTSKICIDEVNKVLGTELNWFSGLKWKNKNEFYLSKGNQYYLFNFDKKTGKLFATIPDTAENATLDAKTGNIAYTIDNNLYIHLASGEDVAITNNKDKNIVSGQAIARREFGITNGIFWSPKGNFLAFYQKDETYVADYPLLNINTTPGSLISIKYPMAGQMSERPKVGIYDLTTKKTVYIAPTGNIDDFLTNLSWTPSEEYVLIAELNRDQNHLKLNRFDAKTGKFINTIYEEKSEIWTEPEHPAYFYSTSSENFIWISEKDGFDNLYLMNTEKGLVKQLTKNKWVVKSIVGHNAKGTEIYFSGTGESPLDTKLFAVQIGSGKQDCLTEICGTHEASVSSDGKYIFDQYENHKTPNIATIMTRKGKIVQKLVESKNKLADYQLGEAKISHLKSEDGFDLFTRMIFPSDFDSTKKYPVLVYVYGGPHAQLITNSWLDGASLWMYWMAEQGYIIFTLDGRGSANRGFAFESVIHRQLGTEELKDQLVGVKYLKSLPYIDANRLAIHGWSFGGFMTTSMMLRNPGIFTTAVAGGPVTDWKYYEVMYGERYMDRPEQNPEGYQKASLLTKTKNLDGKLLLIHGGVDDVVVMQHDLALLKSFIKNEVQVDFFMYPTHKHNVRGKDRVHLMTKVLNYILENNL